MGCEEENVDETENDDNHVGIKLNIELPLTYPDVVPTLDVEIIKGLAEEQRKQILEMANTEAESNIGMPAIFAISECIKSWLVDNNFKGQDDGSMHAQMMRRMKEAERSKIQANQEFESQKEVSEMTEAEQEEYRIRKRREEGTPCTLENFLAWREKFDREMIELAEAKKKEEEAVQSSKNKNKGKNNDNGQKLTGYEIFSSKVGLIDEAIDDGEEDEENFEDMDEELFDDDDDLDDLDFDDEEDFDDDDDEVDI